MPNLGILLATKTGIHRFQCKKELGRVLAVKWLHDWIGGDESTKEMIVILASLIESQFTDVAKGVGIQ